MKFSFGDIVYHGPLAKAYPNGIDYMQIISYDLIRQKYKCMQFDSLAPMSSMCICYIEEEDLDFACNVDPFAEKNFKCNGKPLVPKNVDDLYYEVYDFDGLQQTLIRKAIRHQVNNGIPVKENKGN